jgi:flagella basal body P-ring formation protein FlgA
MKHSGVLVAIKLSAAVAGALALAFAIARAEASDDIALPVPKVTIYPGDVIESEKLSERLFVARTVARGTVFESHDPVIGKVANKTLLLGKPIPVNAVRDPYVVTQGKPTLIIFRDEGLTITSTAMALQNGGIGDIISARNIDSGLIVRGTVQADGTVRVE